MNNYSIDIKKLLGVIDNNIKIYGVENITCSKHKDSPLPPKVLLKLFMPNLNTNIICVKSVVLNVILKLLKMDVKLATLSYKNVAVQIHTFT